MLSTRYYCQIFMNLEFVGRFSKNTRIPNFVKIRQVGAELFQAGGQKDDHDDSNTRFLQYSERT